MISPCNTWPRYYPHTASGGPNRPSITGRRHLMIIAIAAAAFIGLFGLWVVLPKKLLRK